MKDCDPEIVYDFSLALFLLEKLLTLDLDTLFRLFKLRLMIIVYVEFRFKPHVMLFGTFMSKLDGDGSNNAFDTSSLIC